MGDVVTHARRKTLMMKSRTKAQMTAMMSEPSNPYAPMFSASKRNPPTTAPTTPTAKLPISPKPEPLYNSPAIHPASVPMMRNQTMFIGNEGERERERVHGC